jgi:hypothetical protein
MADFIVKIGHETQHSVPGPVTNNFLIKASEWSQTAVETR